MALRRHTGSSRPSAGDAPPSRPLAAGNIRGTDHHLFICWRSVAKSSRPQGRFTRHCVGLTSAAIEVASCLLAGSLEAMLDGRRRTTEKAVTSRAIKRYEGDDIVQCNFEQYIEIAVITSGTEIKAFCSSSCKVDVNHSDKQAHFQSCCARGAAPFVAHLRRETC